ncbi:hypothetical protein MSPP1_000516 [Malassezia sp. CBS 17886]|nr:hypothetical protein MSPP1_000516 [Malassezia sp. CBS 17886]
MAAPTPTLAGGGAVREPAGISADELLCRLRASAPCGTVAPARGDAPPPSARRLLDSTPAVPTMPPFDAHDTRHVLLLDTRPPHIHDGNALDHTSAPSTTGHLRGSVNVQIPTLLLRRFRRAARSTLSPHTDLSLASFVHSDAGIAHLREERDASRAYTAALPDDLAEALLQSLWYTDVVVLFEEGDAGPGAPSAPPGPPSALPAFSGARARCDSPFAPADAATAPRPDSSSFAGHMLLQFLEHAQGGCAAHPAASQALLDARRGIYYVRGGLHAVRQADESHRFFGACDAVAAAPGAPADDRARRACPLVLVAPRPAGAEPQPARARGLPTRPVLSHIDTSVRTRAAAPRSLTLSVPTSSAGAPRGDPGAATAPARTFLAESPLAVGAETGQSPPAARARGGGGMHMSPVPYDALGTAVELEDPNEFEVSTILPGFLYLGSNIQKPGDIARLQELGIRAILNTAAEIEDGGPPDLALPQQFPRYLRIPMRDVVEASGVQKCLADACEFLDRAWLYSSPTYVHCRAGKSRSATVVMAFLIHSYGWTLQQAYAHVAARRERTSPNIGFIAELMHFEHARRSQRRASAVHALEPGSARGSQEEDLGASRRCASVSPHRPTFPGGGAQPGMGEPGPGRVLPRTPCDAERCSRTEVRGADGRYRAIRAPVDLSTNAKRNTVAALGSLLSSLPSTPHARASYFDL